ncbi:MAG: hypothetical protein WC279_12205 [Sulfurimonas sp.]|uniref:hypothetical protein n=1 Tax=Sulfurimonas sp. TaxID=2022749 RepID=UPI003569C678
MYTHKEGLPSVIGCPLCGRKHRDGYCFVKAAVVPDNNTLVEFGDDEVDSDFDAANRED